MGIHDDIIVIGGGLAGITAALAAARHGGSVRVLAHKQSSLRSASGLIDVLGYTPDGAGPIPDPFAVIPELPDGHPYTLVGRSGVENGLELFDEVVAGYSGAHTRRNALVPTHGGTVKPTARYPTTVAAGLASRPQDALLVGFDTIPDFDAPLTADHLTTAGVPFDVRGVTIDFPGGLRDDAKITRYAHLLETNEPVATETGRRGARAALAERVKPHIDGVERVGMPAILGETKPGTVCETLEGDLGATVFEIPMGPPSLPGIRLEHELHDALAAAGVRVTTGNPVVDYEAEDKRISAVVVERNGQRVPYHADQYILATGGLVGKGIDSDRERVFEPLFDCHVPHPADRYDWFADAAFGDHRFARFGVEVTSELHPVDAAGRIKFANLRAAGAVLGGADFAAEKSGSGISLATGYTAGHAAAAAVRGT